MKVGLPCMKLSLSPSSQRHNGKKASTCSVKKAWNEMRDTRQGRDETIDRSKTIENIWIRGDTELDMEAEIRKCIDYVNQEKKAHGKRSLRVDAVTGIELIEKPPMEYMEMLDREEQIRFLSDSGAVVDSILKDWNPDWFTVAQVIHFDEFGGKSPHTHRIIVPLTRDKDGIPAFNAKAELNLKFFNFMNKEYPRRMRERGYSVENCRTYDMMTEEEREEKRRNPPDYGLEGFEYKRKKTRELEERIASQENKIEKLDAREEELEKRNRQLELKNQKMDTVILTKKEVKAMEMPSKTVFGNYSVEPSTYRNLVATAKRVDKVDAREEKLNQRERELAEREQVLEQRSRLPIKDRIELLSLRKLRDGLEKVVGMIHERTIREVLKKLLAGLDPFEEKQVSREQWHEAGGI